MTTRNDLSETNALRLDRGEFKGHAVKTDDGYVRAEAVVTRTGVFPYRNADGSIRRELRHPDDVFRRVSLDTLKMVPITNGHPEKLLVNAENAKALQVGTVGENVWADGQFVMATLQITNADAVADIESGKRELSCGYRVDLVPETGVYNGQPYDFRQTNIRHNHTAIVWRGRAGADARLNLDGDDAEQIDDADASTLREDQMTDKVLKSINLDGIEYQAAPEVVNALAKASARADAAEAEVKTVKADGDKVAAERDALKAKVDAFDGDDAKAKRADEAKAAVKARISLERNAARVLDAAGMAKIDELDDVGLMKACIKAKNADAELDDKSDVYVQARFDAVIEALPPDGEKKRGDALANQREKIAPRADATGPSDLATAKAEATAAMENMHKTDHKERA